MATVYLGVDAELDRPIAVKVLAENLAGDALLRRRFLREARLAARLSHPNVVGVYGAGEWLDRPYIVMELVDGTTVAAELLRTGRMPISRAVEIAVQVCAGLAPAHAAGIVHRDLKPANLLLRDDGLVKIADFGIAKVAGGTGLTGVGTVLGTAAYLAPEQARGEAASFPADIYAVGVLLYELLTGTTPYPAQTLSELVAMQSKGAVARLREQRPDVPSELESIVLRCLAPDPRARPTSAADLGQALAKAASPSPVSDPPTAALRRPAWPRLRRLLKWRPRDPRELPRPAAVAVGLLLLAVTATVVVLAWPNADPDLPAPGPAFDPIPPAADPTDLARNISTWLRSHSR